MDSRTVTLPMADGTAEAYLARPDDGEHPGVLFFMDAIGLRPQIREMVERIAGWGYVVLAPNLFYRSGTAEELAPTRDLREPGAREEFFQGATKRVAALKPSSARQDIAEYVAALTSQPGVTTPIGVTGYCMGARLSTYAATDHPDLVAACGGFHGGRLVIDDPDSPHAGLSRARAEFVYGHADKDGSMPPEAVEALGRALDEAGLTASNEIRPGAPHGYTMADTSMYDEAAAEWHFDALRDLFARTLG